MEFIEILFTKHPAFKPNDQGGVTVIQRANSILMAIFKSLIKAVLLLQESDAELETLLKVDEEGLESPSSPRVMARLADPEYRMWLADRFFIFYLNRSKQYQCNGNRSSLD